jgi:hypothetical protein
MGSMNRATFASVSIQKPVCRKSLNSVSQRGARGVATDIAAYRSISHAISQRRRPDLTGIQNDPASGASPSARRRTQHRHHFEQHRHHFEKDWQWAS